MPPRANQEEISAFFALILVVSDPIIDFLPSIIEFFASIIDKTLKKWRNYFLIRTVSCVWQFLISTDSYWFVWSKMPDSYYFVLFFISLLPQQITSHEEENYGYSHTVPYNPGFRPYLFYLSCRRILCPWGIHVSRHRSDSILFFNNHRRSNDQIKKSD